MKRRRAETWRLVFLLALALAGGVASGCASRPAEVYVSPRWLPQSSAAVAGRICHDKLLVRVKVSSQVPMQSRLEAGTVGRRQPAHHQFTADPLAVVRDGLVAVLSASGCRDQNSAAATVLLRVAIRDARVFSQGSGAGAVYAGIALHATLEEGTEGVFWEKDIVVDKTTKCDAAGFASCSDESCSALATEVMSAAVVQILSKVHTALMQKGLLGRG